MLAALDTVEHRRLMTSTFGRHSLQRTYVVLWIHARFFLPLRFNLIRLRNFQRTSPNDNIFGVERPLKISLDNSEDDTAVMEFPLEEYRFNPDLESGF